MYQISIYESIDKLTNSIENTITNESFSTLVTEMTDWKRHKPKDWVFEWKKESTSNDRKVYKLTTIENPDVTQGLISMFDKN